MLRLYYWRQKPQATTTTTATLKNVNKTWTNNVYNNHRNHIRGGLPYETGGDARGEFWIKPQKETNLGVAQPFWPLKEIILNFKKVKRMENT